MTVNQAVYNITVLSNCLHGIASYYDRHNAQSHAFEVILKQRFTSAADYHATSPPQLNSQFLSSSPDGAHKEVSPSVLLPKAVALLAHNTLCVRLPKRKWHSIVNKMENLNPNISTAWKVTNTKLSCMWQKPVVG